MGFYEVEELEICKEMEMCFDKLWLKFDGFFIIGSIWKMCSKRNTHNGSWK